MINTKNIFYVQIIYSLAAIIASVFFHPFLILLSIGNSLITYMIINITKKGYGTTNRPISASMSVMFICLLVAQLYLVFRFAMEPFNLLKILGILAFIVNALLAVKAINTYIEYSGGNK